MDTLTEEVLVMVTHMVDLLDTVILTVVQSVMDTHTVEA